MIFNKYQKIKSILMNTNHFLVNICSLFLGWEPTKWKKNIVDQIQILDYAIGNNSRQMGINFTY